jgi:hypothetical protein
MNKCTEHFGLYLFRHFTPRNIENSPVPHGLAIVAVAQPNPCLAFLQALAAGKDRTKHPISDVQACNCMPERPFYKPTPFSSVQQP